MGSLLCHLGKLVVGLGVGALGLTCSTICGILVPQQGIKPLSPALQGEFLTTGPPSKEVPGFGCINSESMMGKF